MEGALQCQAASQQLEAGGAVSGAPCPLASFQDGWSFIDTAKVTGRALSVPCGFTGGQQKLRQVPLPLPALTLQWPTIIGSVSWVPCSTHSTNRVRQHHLCVLLTSWHCAAVGCQTFCYQHWWEPLVLDVRPSPKDVAPYLQASALQAFALCPASSSFELTDAQARPRWAHQLHPVHVQLAREASLEFFASSRLRNCGHSQEHPS